MSAGAAPASPRDRLREPSLRGACLRAAAAPLGWGFGAAAGVRNWLYARGAREVADLGRPALSIGNLTAGGTGKTPMSFWILSRALAAGVRPALLTRGYGGDGSDNDEVAMLRERFPQVPVGVGADRVASARGCVTSGARCDGFVLDDAFQHRRVRRDLDLLLVDATDPFGGNAYLPRGLLRESPRGAARAHVVVLTRADQATDDARAAAWRALQSCGYGGPQVEAAHRPDALVALGDGARRMPLDSLRGRAVRTLSSIGNPAGFARTLEQLGAPVAARLDFPDHHRYLPADLPDLRDGADGSLWITTEKDAAKLRRLGVIDGWLLRVELSITRGEKDLAAAVDAWLSKCRASAPQ